MDNTNFLESLLASAASIGIKTRSEIESAKAIADKAKQRAADAKAQSDDRTFEGSGFASPRYNGLVEVAGLWGKYFNADSQDARDAQAAMATSFMSSMTGQTDKSLNGGKRAGYASVIGMGANAARAQRALQQRLDHWRREHDSAPEGESPKDAAERKAKARRHLSVYEGGPDVEGGTVCTAKDGSVKPPRFCGRPSGVFGGVPISFARGRDRDSQFAEFARLYAEHGDKVLLPEVVDAFLDNGGRFKADSEVTVESACGAALAAIDQIMSLGGKGSGDTASLMAAHFVIERIRTEGFKSSQVAAAPEPEVGDGEFPVDITFEPGLAAKLDAQIAAEQEPEVGDVLAGVGSEPEAPAQGASEPAEGEGVALGAPAASKRPRRNRGGKEAQAGV